ncbi:DUF488 domain-containing protein [Pseudomonas panipatensis]|uniref:Uncharacterized conserved protein YeaO, DUF488 family n=1 Tax=Pseudomonas panipatensis TaxID=428992 RepID=A0A1G8BSX0_9PSED|nr:DUF488 domain-containing protein [Pseudomonas panipatensis]SDH36261.1 Uncharacterized conserved protein YeaO, DUF488 family [Pseudomonas panipatensis]SMP71814.1 Uncharacterized conserved protein YeaO, DUF488 family [Pseudomonas panipatensis]
MIRCKRAYEAVAEGDGYRVLVDRLWPRGLRKEALALDEWLKEVAPSNALRQRFHQDPADYEAFCRDYRAELAAHPEHWWRLLDIARQGQLTLLYGARDTQHNNARALADFLDEELERQQPGSSPTCYAGLSE